MPRLKLGLVLSLALLMSALLILHAPWVNGPSYWAWGYRRLSTLTVYGGMLMAAVPFFVGLWLEPRGHKWRIAALALMMFSSWELSIVSVAARRDPPSLSAIPPIVFNPQATSYFTDANTYKDLSLEDLISQYQDLMPSMHLHSMIRPPGPLLYWRFFVQQFGYTEHAAILGALGLCALGTLSIPATYLLLKHLLNDINAAFCGAAFLALSPGFVLFVPTFDPAYILLSCGLIGFWSLSLREDQMRWSLATGLTLGATTFITYNILVIGLIMLALAWVSINRPGERKLEIIAKHGTVAIAGALMVQLGLQFTLEFHPLNVFFTAWANQQDLLKQHAGERPWPWTVPFDLTDFALGSGWIGFLLAGYYFVTHRHDPPPDDQPPSPWMVATLSAGQILAVAITGLLPLETARVWNFLLPLLMVPVGLELRHWPRRQRYMVYGALLLVTAAVCQNLTFIGDH
jgi:hypothetical protein